MPLITNQAKILAKNKLAITRLLESQPTFSCYECTIRCNTAPKAASSVLDNYGSSVLHRSRHGMTISSSEESTYEDKTRPEQDQGRRFRLHLRRD
jgi:hypothetical protein